MMTFPRKIVWAEGTLLGQQHFQQAELYWQNYYWQQLQGVQIYPYGLMKLVFSTATLLNGQLQLKECTAVFPNGQLIQYTADQCRPINYNFRMAPGETQTLYLCLPAGKQVDGMQGYPELLHAVPYQANYRKVGDELDPQREREVLFAELNLKLQLESELDQDVQRLAVAKIYRNNQGQYELANDFIPLMLNIKVAPVLLEYMTQWEQLLRAKVIYLQALSADSVAAITAKEMHWLILLPWLNRIAVLLQQCQIAPLCHPYPVFLLMQEALAVLASQTKAKENKQDVIYLHDNLSETFALIDSEFHELLNSLLPVSTQKIELRQQTESLYISNMIDPTLLAKQQFILAVQPPLENPDWIAQFTRQIKISAPSKLEAMLTSALPGIKLQYLQRPPQYLEIKLGFEYFYLEPAANYWEAITDEKQIAIFLPTDFANSKIELIALPKQ